MYEELKMKSQTIALLLIILGGAICGVMADSVVSPTHMALIEYLLVLRGSSYTRPPIRDNVQAREQARFKKDLDVFYSAITAVERDDAVIEALYNKLINTWKGDSARNQLIDQAYNNYQLITITWGQ